MTAKVRGIASVFGGAGLIVAGFSYWVFSALNALHHAYHASAVLVIALGLIVAAAGASEWIGRRNR